MTPQEKVIQVAQEEVGYLEKATNSNLDSKTANAGKNNWTKYARDLDNLNAYNGKKNGYAWCDMFVDWCFMKTFGFEKAFAMTGQPPKGYGAGCTSSANYYKQMKQFFASPQVGDQIFFSKDGGKSMYHTGLVVKVDKQRVYTIEGNTSSTPGVVENGGAVAEKSYLLTDKKIGGYGRPDWSLAPKETKAPSADPWYKEEAEWVKKMGIADGTRGDEPCTRAEAWAMLQRMYDKLK